MHNIFKTPRNKKTATPWLLLMRSHSTNKQQFCSSSSLFVSRSLESPAGQKWSAAEGVWNIRPTKSAHLSTNIFRWLPARKSFPLINSSCVGSALICSAAHLVQNDNSLFASSGYIENVRLLRVQDGKLQQGIFSQIRVCGSETAHFHTWSC